MNLEKFAVAVFIIVLHVIRSSVQGDRIGCVDNVPIQSQQPANRVNTYSRLVALRNLIHDESKKSEVAQAILITVGDDHQTEFVSNYYQRLQYISGFSGSNGEAVVTAKKAALWTDGRYHILADEELDCNWLLMKTGKEHVPTKAEWINSEFPEGGAIIADPKVISAKSWMELEASLKEFNENLSLIKSHENLVDQIWFARTKPPNTKEPFILDIEYAGKTWIEKLKMVRNVLKMFEADALVITALDEIAWLLNIRGYDVPFSNLIEVYAILSRTELIVYTDLTKIKGIRHSFEDQKSETITFKNYLQIWNDLPILASKYTLIMVPSSAGYSLGASKNIYDLVPDKKRLFLPSPIVSLKQQKNDVEIVGMERAHIRDAVALCRFLCYLEHQFSLKTNSLDELQLVDFLSQFRSEEKLFLGTSFSTIMGYGAHGAIPHYVPNKRTSSIILGNSTIVIDSGGQYYDGTTDVTRTIHLGIPTKEHKQAYTRVLIGSIQMSNLIFPEDLSPSGIDVMARAPLWSIGYDYGHGTSHGIGYSLNVHEANVNVHYNDFKTPRFTPGIFLSNEPGYYKEGDFGIRLENIMEVVQKINLKFKTQVFLGFKDVTLVPYVHKLLDADLLEKSHIKWLNKYNARIRNFVGPEILQRNDTRAYEWMLKNTEYIPEI